MNYFKILGIAFGLLDYNSFHKWIAGMLSKDRGKKIVGIDIAVQLFGAIIVSASLLLY